MHKYSVVLGIGFGDEGKGITTDYLCHHILRQEGLAPMVVRFSGGHQAGHTVYVKESSESIIKHIFSSFGSGTLRGCPTYLSQFCTVDPIAIMNEYNVLKEQSITPTLYINPECPVTTPYDVFYNQNDEENKKNGSCGRGINSTFRREENFYSLHVSDLKYPSILNAKLELISSYYGFEVYTDRFLEAVKFLLECPTITLDHVEDFTIGNNYVFEGSQGLLLDQHHGFFPNVTPSNTGLTNISKLIDINDIDIYCVIRAYQTRHGNGFMTNNDLPNNIRTNVFETNVCNKYQGEFRRSILDLDLLKYGLERHKLNSHKLNLVVTNVDQVQNALVFTENDKIEQFSTQEGFLLELKSRLGIEGDLLFSTSPFSEEFHNLL